MTIQTRKRKVGSSLLSDLKSHKADPMDVEISSDSGGEEEDKYAAEDSSDEDETAQEKRLRLTKQYLDELHSLEDSESVGEKLANEVLEEAGRLQKKIAQKCLPPDPESIRCVRGHRLSVTCIAVASTGDVFFTASKDCSIIKWDFDTKKKLAIVKGGKKLQSDKTHGGHILTLALTTDVKFLASGGLDKVIHIWNPEKLQHIHRFIGHRGPVSGLAFRINARQLYSSSHDRTVKVWDLDSMGYVETLFGHQDGVQSCDSMNRERCATSGGRDGTIRVWKIVEESQLVFNGPGGTIDVLRMINEEHMVSGSDDGSVCVWSLQKKRPLVTIKNAHSDSKGPTWITSVTSLINSDLIATGSYDGFIRVWKCSDRFIKVESLFKIPVCGFVNDLRFSPNGKYLLAAVAKEHKLGRWWCKKEAKNSVVIVPLQG